MKEGRDGDWGAHDRPSRDVRRDVQDEIDFHIEMRVRDNLRRGLSPEEAREEARRRFGELSDIRREMVEVCRGEERTARRRRRVGDVLGDVRFAVRSLVHRPGFAALAVVTLALGIGATTAVFSLANWLLLQPVPGVTAPDQLATVRFASEGSSAAFSIAHPDYLDLAEAPPGLTGLAAVHRTGSHVAVAGAEPHRLEVALASANHAEVLGLAPVVGRTLGPGDASDPHVAMLSDRLARAIFGSAAEALGRAITLNGRSFTVVGVAPPDFLGISVPGDTDVWVPVEAHRTVLPTYPDDVLTDREGSTLWITVFGRLADGATVGSAEARLREATSRLVEASPGSSLRSFMPNLTAGIGLPEFAREQVTELLAILGAVAVFLSLLGCANVANLMLARGVGRRPELAVRRALGAGRGRLVRQLTTEALVIAVAACAVGLLIAYGSVQVFRGERILSWMPRLTGLQVSEPVLFFALAMSLATTLLFGVLPAFVTTRDIASSVRDRWGGGPSRALVVAQVAISLTLVVGAGLLLDTVLALRSTELGFRPDGVVEASLDPGTQGYGDAERALFFRNVVTLAGGVPDIASVGIAGFPVQGQIRNGYRLRAEGIARDDDRAVSATANQVTPGFLDALGIELLEGRDFRWDETFQAGTQDRVVILSEGAAEAAFPDGSAVGRRVDIGYRDPVLAEVVGVVRDARMQGVKEQGGALVLDPFGSAGWTPSFGTVYARGAGTSTPSVERLRALLTELDPSLPLYDVQPLTKRVDQDLTVERMLARVTALFAGLAVGLAAVGLYGVMSITVQSRRRELGIRLALGADAHGVRSLVVRQGLRMTVVGIVLGLVAASQASGLIATRLWGVRPLDPFVFGTAAATLLAMTLLACWIPARRATSVDPVEALRSE